MSDKREAPLGRLWHRAKERAPRQKTIASVIRTVRATKPRSEETARAALVAEAAKQGITDLSDKELRVMTDGVVLSAREAAGQAVSKGVAGVRSLWTGLQTPTPDWVALPDDVAALNIRSDQSAVSVPILIDAPDVVQRLATELPADSDGTRKFDCWLSFDGLTQTTFVHVGNLAFGRVPASAVAPIRHVLTQRRAWTPATVQGSGADATVSIVLPAAS